MARQSGVYKLTGFYFLSMKNTLSCETGKKLENCAIRVFKNYNVKKRYL